MMKRNEKNRFTAIHGALILMAVQALLYLTSIGFAVLLYLRYAIGLFAGVLLFYGTLVCLTLLVLKLFRVLYPLKPGVYGPKDTWVTFLVGFQWILSALNLHWLCVLTPSLYKKFFYRLLGAKMGSGTIPIEGALQVP